MIRVETVTEETNLQSGRLPHPATSSLFRNSPSSCAPLQLPRQRQLLHGDVEEEHADVLAGDALPRRGRTRDPAEARRVVHGAGADDEELPVAHGRHGGPGGCAGGLGRRERVAVRMRPLS